MSRWNPKHQTTHIPRWPTQPTLLQKRVPIPTWFLPIFHKKFRMMPSTMLFLKVSMFHHQTQTVTYQSPKWLKMYKIPFINTLNCTSNNYSACFSKLTKHIGSFWQCILTLPHIAYLHASSVHYDEYPVVIDNGATRHKWTDFKVLFLSLKLIIGTFLLPTTITSLLKGVAPPHWILMATSYNSMFFILALQFSLYSVKQHRKYTNYACLFNNKATTLACPEFQFDIDNEFDLLIYAKSIHRCSQIIYWTSTDGQAIHGQQISRNSHPISHCPLS